MATHKASLLIFVFKKASAPLLMLVFLVTTAAVKTMIMPKSEPSSHYPLRASISRCSSAREDFLLLPKSSQLHSYLAFSHRRNPQIEKTPRLNKCELEGNRQSQNRHEPSFSVEGPTIYCPTPQRSCLFFLCQYRTFLFLSLLILSFCTIVENGTTHVTSFIYRDPSLKALLSRLDLTGNNNSNRFRSPEDPSSAAFRRHRRSPFLHFTRVGL